MTERRLTLPVGREPTDEEVVEAHDFLEGLDWFSDYDNGLSIQTPQEALRAGPGQTIVVDDNFNVRIEGIEVQDE